MGFEKVIRIISIHDRISNVARVRAQQEKERRKAKQKLAIIRYDGGLRTVRRSPRHVAEHAGMGKQIVVVLSLPCLDLCFRIAVGLSRIADKRACVAGSRKSKMK